MNPYRQAPLTVSVKPKKLPGLTLRQKIGCATYGTSLVVAINTAAWHAHWGLYFVPFIFLGLFAMIITPLNRNARTRLCRLMWSRGDHAGAVLLYTGVIVLNRTRLARVQAYRRSKPPV